VTGRGAALTARAAPREIAVRSARIAGLALLAAALTGCLPTAATSQGRAVNDLWLAFLVPAIVVAAIVWGLTTLTIVRFRRRSREAALPAQTEGHLGLELTWTALPVVTVLVLFGLSLVALSRIEAVAPGGVDVTVTAFRWQWRIDYPAEGVSVIGTPEAGPEIVVPVGEPIHVTLESPDVVHSFYVPAFLFKRDAVPGRSTTFELTVDEPGTYRGQCAEFCGVFHARMLFTVRAVEPAEFDSWLATAGSAP
jgi:cytochrome c oxidase subunit 2